MSSSIARQAGLIGLTAFGGALIGFVLQLLVAYYFGASGATDAFFMASSLSELLTKLLMGGSITAVFLPMFVQYLAQNERARAWDLALNVLHIATILFAVLLVLVGAFARPLVSFIAPGFDAATQALTVLLLYVLLPSFLFFFLVDLLIAMLHALQRFTIPALLRLITPLVSVVCVLLLQRSLGIYALAIGVVIGAALQVVVVASGLFTQGFRYHWQLNPRDPNFKRLVYLVYPFIFSMLVTQAAGITYRVLVSDLSTGSLSAIKYAEKITQLLTIIFISSITTVVYPRLAHAVGKLDFEGVLTTLAYALRLLLLLTVPLWIGASMLHEPIINLVYGHGSFTNEAVALTGQALLFLSISLWTNAISSLLGHAVLALQRTRAAVAVTVASHAVAVMLFVLLVPRMQVAGLALASSLVPLSSALLYYIHLYPLLPGAYRIFWQGTLLKIAVLAVGLALFLWAWQQWVPVTTKAFNATVLQLLLPAGFGALLFFAGAYVWRLEEMRDLINLFTKRFKRLLRV